MGSYNFTTLSSTPHLGSAIKKMPDNLSKVPHFVDYSRHGVARPRLWNKPKAKTYELNEMGFSAYYQPMLEHIERKTVMETLGMDFDLRKKVEMHTLLSRSRVQLPSSNEVSQMSAADVFQAPLRLESFLGGFKRKQLKERNSKIVQVKCAMNRNSKSADTVSDKRTSTLVRDQYINMISQLYNEG